LYVRRGMQHERLETTADFPGVSMRLCTGEEGARGEGFVVASVHLPTGDCAGRREMLLQEVCGKRGGDAARVVVLGDMNAKDDEIAHVCKSLKMREARYAGVSWGMQGNRFYEDMTGFGNGLKKDRVLFGEQVWAETHLVGQQKQFFDESEFYLSDHFGIMAYVDVDASYSSRVQTDVACARVRRGQLVQIREEAAFKELQEVKAKRQEGREEKHLHRQRVAENDRASFQRSQMREAQARRKRRTDLRQSAFGAESLFASSVVATPALSSEVPCSPCHVVIPTMNDMPCGSWQSTSMMPRRGMRNGGKMCYINSVAHRCCFERLRWWSGLNGTVRMVVYMGKRPACFVRCRKLKNRLKMVKATKPRRLWWNTVRKQMQRSTMTRSRTSLRFSRRSCVTSKTERLEEVGLRCGAMPGKLPWWSRT